MLKDKLEASPDRSVAVVKLAKQAYTPKELEALIDRLGKLRAELLPAVPEDPPPMKEGDWAMGIRRFNINYSIDTRHTVLQLRHTGFGWLTFAFGDNGAHALAQSLANLQQAIGAAAVDKPPDKLN